MLFALNGTLLQVHLKTRYTFRRTTIKHEIK